MVTVSGMQTREAMALRGADSQAGNFARRVPLSSIFPGTRTDGGQQCRDTSDLDPKMRAPFFRHSVTVVPAK